MGLLDELTFEPDEELRRFLEDYDKYGPNAESWPDHNPDKGGRAIPPYRGRTPLNKLRTLRNERILTQAQLAAKAGTTRRTIIAIENNRRQPSVYLALAIAEVLKHRVEDIFQLSSSVEIPVSKH